MFKKMQGLLLMGLLLLTLGGCGSGGGGVTVQQPPTSAVLKLSAQGVLTQGKSIAGTAVAVRLPQGVTVKTDAAGKVAGTVVVPSGVASQATFTPPVYIPASSSAPAQLSFVMASTQTNGYGTGEFVTINCDLSAGASPKATDFAVIDFDPIDLNGAHISGLSATFTADLK